MADVQTPSFTTTIPTPQLSNSTKDAFITRLDTLLEQYLNTLDQYEKLQQQLSKQLSSAYFSLTQANFHNRSGIYYGQDRYDERVQATRKIVVSEDGQGKVRFETHSSLDKTTGTGDAQKADPPAHEDEHGEKQKQEDVVGDHKHDATPDPANDADGAEGTSDAAKTTAVDPIRMFGILVPPPLRSAQMSFKEAFAGPVVRLAEVTGELRALEREIGRARKGIRKAQGAVSTS